MMTCLISTTLPSFPTMAWPLSDSSNILHQQASGEKWPSCCRPTCTWYKLLLPRGRKPRNRHSRAVLRNRLPKWHYGRTSSLSPSCQRLHTMTYRSDTRGTALRPDPWPFSKSLTKDFNRIRHLRDGNTHTFGKRCTRVVELHDSASSVMLALPSDVIRGRLVRNEAEWRFVLPHLSCHIVPHSQFIDKTVSLCIEDKTTNSVECFCGKQLDFGIEVVDRTVTETLLRGTRGISNIPCAFDNKREKSMSSKRSQSRWSLAYKNTGCV